MAASQMSATETGALDLSAVAHALHAVYDPRTTNETRFEASNFLEEAKRHPQAPSFGFSIASDQSSSAELRHYGLSILEHAIRYKWESYNEEQAAEIRDSVVKLAFATNDQDPVLVRNKLAQLWVEAAKRSWAIQWINMDELLVQLWTLSSDSVVQKTLVLHILETLSEETFNREDPTVGLRGTDLGQACVEIFTPASIMTDLHTTRGGDADLRSGSEGWLQRVSDLLEWCLGNDLTRNASLRSVALRCLTTLRAVSGWIMLSAMDAAHVIQRLQAVLSVGSLDLQTAAVETLITIFGRTSFNDEHFQMLMPVIFTTDGVSLLKNLFEYSAVSFEDLDDDKYTLSKKVTELFSYLGSLLEQRLHLVTDQYDLAGFLSLLFQIMQHPSLLITIPVLHIWTKFLRSKLLRDYPVITSSIGGLLEICSYRLIRYEAFPNDSTDDTFRFLNEDIDTVPERHAFLGNYRRYCTDVIEVVVKRLPVDAMNHLLQQAMTLFQAAANEQANFRPQEFSRNDPSILKIDAQITIIDAATKGYLKWLANQGPEAQKNESDRIALQDTFEQYGRGIMSMTFRDPEIKRKIFQLLVNISTKPLHDRPSFASTILDHLMQPPMVEEPDLQAYSEAVKSLLSASMQEIGRLGMTFPDHFLSIYSELNVRIDGILSHPGADDRQRMGYQAFLFIIVHRSTGLDPTVQKARLEEILGPLRTEWQKADLSQGLSNFSSFCDLLGLSPFGKYITSHQFHKIEDWHTHQLDAEGKALQARIIERCDSLPLRLSKSLLAASTEKIEEGSPQWDLSCALWSDLIYLLLPNLLQLISYAQAFNNMQSWENLPNEIQAVIQRILTDRFWQSGISTESRDAFFARVSSSKSSYEGFASSVRGSVRQIRETGYWIIYGFIRFKDVFYSIPDLSGPLSQALFAHASALSSHHFSVLLNMAIQLIQGCPPRLRHQFLPNVISALFLQLDTKITGEWDAIRRHKEQHATDGQSLGDEMKKESILRNLTFTAMAFAYSLLDSHQPGTAPAHSNADVSGTPPSTNAFRMHVFILSTPEVTEPLLMFLRNAIRYQDTRSCSAALRTLRIAIPSLPLQDAQQGPMVRRFLSDELLKAAITSLHEPYFIDAQKDLASLIAQILSIGPASDGESDLSRDVLLSLPGLTNRPDKVGHILSKLRQGGGSTLGDKHVRAMVLDLLKNVRGQSIQEQGRIMPDKSSSGTEVASKARKERSKLQEQYMSVDEAASAGGMGNGGEDGLAGIADMFQGA